MTARIRFALLLALLLLPVGLRAQPAPDDANPNITAQKRTVVDIRNVGSAMWGWYKDQMAPRRSEAAHARAEAKAQEDATNRSVDFTQVPVISREDLTALLVPKYIAAIPAEDGWGHPYEFRLNTTDPNAIEVMGVRSGGLDGQLSDGNYTVDGFKATDFDQDISWLDGFFVRWPEPAKDRNGR
jgi:hypothetical protein